MSIDKNTCIPYVESEDEQFRTAVSSLRREDIPLKDDEVTTGAEGTPSDVRSETTAAFPQARCELSPRDVRQFPGQRAGTTTKDRRYMAQRVKATDQSKTLGKRPGSSGKSYQQIKSEDFPHSDV